MFEFWRYSIQCSGHIQFLEEKSYTVTWTWDQHHGARACILLTLYPVVNQGVNPVPSPYLPSQKEKGNPQQNYF